MSGLPLPWPKAHDRPFDWGVDLGSHTVRLVRRGEGVVAEVENVIALRHGLEGSSIVAIGREAAALTGRAPADIKVVRPVRAGTIVDYEAAEQLLRHLFAEAGATGRRSRAAVLATTPFEATEVHRRALQDCIRAAGAAEVRLVPSYVASALGAELPLTTPKGHLLVHIGAGRTAAVVLTAGGAAVRRAIGVGGDALDEALLRWVRTTHHALLPAHEARRLRHNVAAAHPSAAPRADRLRVRDLSTGQARLLDLTSHDLVEALTPLLDKTRDLVLDTLREAPPELAADILGQGVVLCGGAAQLRGLDALLRKATSLPVLLAQDPARCTAHGLDALLQGAFPLDQLPDR